MMALPLDGQQEARPGNAAGAVLRQQPSAAPDTKLAQMETDLLKQKGLSGYKLQQQIRAELRRSRKRLSKLHRQLYPETDSDSSGSDSDSPGSVQKSFAQKTYTYKTFPRKHYQQTIHG